MLLGEVLDAANQTEQATAEFEAAVKASSSEPEVHFGLGYLYWKQKRYEDALANSKPNWRASPSIRKP